MVDNGSVTNHYEYSQAYISANDVAGSENLNLYTKVINPLSNKTYFDMLFDKVYPASSSSVYTSNSDYATYEENILKNNYNKVTTYSSKIKGTKVSL